ncbi:uncharacterized protein PHACADRAFT_135496 [Phanerochaete carnosa HHB-10118-sp]|uniref:RNA-dependent RNA polymerase n=1 Tax=Phanerochaete carnosa (strain HHB-10118-sp) TaxID=650164 RepID=K5WCG5_PHACS|nr:uncharacterized protein PHACADRAFT_135496 [Phanerochaete carnosa HHB-10118-sp]EKM61658.1 hypothetical protein PHACADRAFT_135496 [Phanerochaete carnosa HHB-10118-sp]
MNCRQELDCEQSALVENQDRGLGLKGEWSGVPSWYGGKIQQTCHLQRVSEATFKLTLGKMEMRRSHRFARFLGSRRLLQIKLPESFSDRTAEKEFLNQKFVLCGRVFQVFAAKEEKAYAMEVGEDYDRLPCKSEGDFYRLSLEEFVARHSPLHLNAAQPVSKFNARFDLGLSTSRPVLHFFLPELIEIIDDQYAPLDDPARKVPPEKIYTDGCGFMNGAALKVIKDTLGLDALPCAVQGRVFGSKGVWVLHPEHADVYGDELPRIWIRRSQQKVQLAMDMDPGELEALHPVHFIFDLVAVPRVSTSPHLNRHTIANLHHNGVPVSAFAELMRTDVDKMIVPLMQIKGPFAMPLLWRNVDNNEGVTRQRILQLALGAQRVLGLASRNEVPEDDEDVEDDTDEVTSSDAVNPLVLSGSRYLPGGKPISVAERFMRLIGAGFTPEEEYTHDEYQKVRDRVLKAFFDNLRLPLRASAEAFIVPDPTGKLRENEIYFRSSTLAFEDSPNIYDCHLMLGDCLLYRNPARLASDVRKVRAVDVPELVLYKDVIVVPCKGPVSLPSMLAGGDVDGDTAVCIWDPALVKPFTNAELVTVPDGFKEENFEPEDEIVAVQTLWEDIDPARRSDAQERSVILQRHLVSGVSASRTGLYSKYHDLAMFMFGYAHEQTQRIALMFNFILDSRKSGMVVKPDIFIADKRRFDYDIPECMGESSLAGNPRRPLRKEGLGRFVLEQLQDAAKEIEGNVKKRCETQLSGLAVKKDADIVALWKQYSDVPLLQDETAAVRDFVNDCYQKWLSIWGRSPSKRDRVFYGSKKEAQESRSKNDASRRAVAAEFNEGPDPARTSVLRKLGLLDKAMAACAYAAGRKFAFDVAFTQLTLIKAEKCGIAPTTELMSNFLTMPASAVKVLTSRLEVTGG